jgi:hypothetical protein
MLEFTCIEIMKEYIYITTSFLIRLDSEGKNIYITSGDRVHFDERMIE